MRPSAWAVPLVLGLLVPVTAFAQKPPKEIDGLYRAFVKAYDAKDVKGVMALTTPDLTLKQRTGVLDARQTREMLEATFATPSKLKTTYRIQSCQVRGSTAVCRVSMTSQGRMSDPEGTMRAISATSVSNHLLVRTAKGWRIKSSDTLSETVLVDGKPLAAPSSPASDPGPARRR